MHLFHYKKNNSISFKVIFITVVIINFFIDDPYSQTKPNILFIISDDQSYETVNSLRPYDMDNIETPSLDRMVSEGVAFTQAFNMGSWTGAVCVASRAMLNTGRFVWNANSINLGTELQNGRFWSEHMESAGYRTYMTGKWHVNADVNQAFDVTGTVRSGMPGTVNASYDRPKNQLDPFDTWNPYDESLGGFWSGGKHWSEVVGDEAIGFIEDASASNQPFFMYVAFNAPHDPRQSPKEYVDKYPWQDVKVPLNFLPEYPYRYEINLHDNRRDERLAPFPRTEFSIQVNRQEYYAIITHMDEQIGRIMDALDSSGKANNTYVFFTSDHGLAVGHHGLVGKQNLYDHSMHVPFLMKGPNIPANQKLNMNIYLQDVMPTVLELAGLQKPTHVDFESLLPLIRGEKEKSYDAVYGTFESGSQRAVMQGGYKLFYYPNIPLIRLYHIAEDPYEMNDLASDTMYSYIKYKLWQTMNDQAQIMDDPHNFNYSVSEPDLSIGGCRNPAYTEYDSTVLIDNPDACITGIFKKSSLYIHVNIKYIKGQLIIQGRERYKLRLFDLNGTVVFDQEMVNQGTQIFTPNLRPGIYQTVVSFGKESIVFKKISVL